MKILGIDYGRRKMGLALADGPLAEPYEVIRVENFRDAIEKVSKVSKASKVSKIVIGVSEGKMGKEAREFSLSLSTKLKIPVKTFDETLSTADAQRMAIEAGQPRARRRRFEDAYAATVMLQNYLDMNT